MAGSVDGRLTSLVEADQGELILQALGGSFFFTGEYNGVGYPFGQRSIQCITCKSNNKIRYYTGHVHITKEGYVYLTCRCDNATRKVHIVHDSSTKALKFRVEDVIKVFTSNDLESPEKAILTASETLKPRIAESKDGSCILISEQYKDFTSISIPIVTTPPIVSAEVKRVVHDENKEEIKKLSSIAQVTFSRAILKALGNQFSFDGDYDGRGYPIAKVSHMCTVCKGTKKKRYTGHLCIESTGFIYMTCNCDRGSKGEPQEYLVKDFYGPVILEALVVSRVYTNDRMRSAPTSPPESPKVWASPEVVSSPPMSPKPVEVVLPPRDGIFDSAAPSGRGGQAPSSQAAARIELPVMPVLSHCHTATSSNWSEVPPPPSPIIHSISVASISVPVFTCGISLPDLSAITGKGAAPEASIPAMHGISEEDANKIDKGTHIRCGFNKLHKPTRAVRSCGKVMPASSFSGAHRVCGPCRGSKMDVPSAVATRLAQMKVVSAVMSPATPIPVEERRSFVIAEERYMEMKISKQMQDLSDLLGMIDQARFDNECSWRTIGRAIYNIVDGNMEEGLKIWSSCLADDGESKKAKMARDWEGFDGGAAPPVTIKTLQYYAMLDSKERKDAKYSDWHLGKCVPLITATLDPTTKHGLMAEAIAKFFELRYMSNGHSKLWIFDEYKHTLKEDVGCGFLVFDIMNMFRRVVAEVKSAHLKNKAEADDAKRARGEKVEEKADPTLKQLDRKLLQLDDADYCKKLAKLLLVRFNVEHIDEYIDMNPEILGVTNGIIECCDVEAIHRSGSPEDYLTITAPTEYVPYDGSYSPYNGVGTEGKYDKDRKVENGQYANYDGKREGSRMLDEWLKKVFHVAGSEHTFRMWSASILHGVCKSKKFLLAAGERDASKSALFALFEKMLGEVYFQSPGSDFFCPDQSGGRSTGPDPFLATIWRARIVYIGEMGVSKLSDGNKWKQYTSGGMDKKSARACYQNGGAKPIRAHPVAAVNEIIPGSKVIGLEGVDGDAIKARVLHMDFTTRFCTGMIGDVAPTDPAEQKRLHRYPQDKEWGSKLGKMCKALLSLIVHDYREFKAIGGNIPEVKEFKEKMDAHWAKTCIYDMFITEALVRSEHERISPTTLYEVYQYWYKKTHGTSGRPVSLHVFINMMIRPNRLGPLCDIGRPGSPQPGWYYIGVARGYDPPRDEGGHRRHH